MTKYPLAGMGILILVLVIIVCPVQAFSAKNLDISIQDNTNAIITFSYDLSWYESIAVFSRIADPGTELAKALRTQFKKNVEVTSVTGNSAQFQVENFASRAVNDGAVSLNTPSLSFKNADKVLKKYWFASFISPDFSPEITRVSFPDGYSEEFYNRDLIPSVHHTLVMPA
ncbi:MAG: hypothetical protein CVV30_04360 [Methanomicrobiales archaeon HGW-Methanomicrobiales-1]|jgi:hypothetical protein|nr:MAG: hypothetical protein CVV30_04360 [Methanomicrobiales archaeon HGW-Methanomicrobiales-1]